MLPIIETNASRLRALHARVEETVRLRDRSPEDRAAWSAACDEFHSRYDQLAFPGGLARGLKKILASDLDVCAVALEYLEDTPYCFRSQYVATSLRRALNKATLSDRLRERFELIKAKSKQ